jgi:peptide/nickel transport system substrate-binding protein
MQQMWAGIGLNIKVQMMESAEWLKLVNRPYAENRSAMLIAEQHDNNNGDAAFTMPFRYRTGGQQSETSIPALDAMLDKAGVSTGPERTKLYQDANRMIAQDVVPDVPMFHMVAHLRVSPRVVYKPNSLSDLQLEIAQIKFAKP